MKAKLLENGTLVISPETGVEAYALNLWKKSYENDEETLIVHTTLDKKPKNPKKKDNEK